MTDKGMSFLFRYTAQEKTYKTLRNLDKKKTFQKVIMSLYNIINSRTHCSFQFFPHN